MTRDEALRQIGELHSAWAQKYGDNVPIPTEAAERDRGLWNADAYATGEQQDELNQQIVDILNQID